MDSFSKIAVLNNIIEAQLLDSILTEQEIPHVMRTYHDSAYDGLFQVTMGWGHVEAPEAHRTEILAILDEIRIRSQVNDEDIVGSKRLGRLG
ncbi:MAG: hypothetical protein EHM85_02865 [Desulfobacteraceae bacterium]|nr:MAG: hypothetical protein EHM85_02865 [Desulfobacteraceae bacterium]